jgi:hypothetical protein
MLLRDEALASRIYNPRLIRFERQSGFWHPRWWVPNRSYISRTGRRTYRARDGSTDRKKAACGLQPSPGKPGRRSTAGLTVTGSSRRHHDGSAQHTPDSSGRHEFRHEPARSCGFCRALWTVRSHRAALGSHNSATMTLPRRPGNR